MFIFISKRTFIISVLVSVVLILISLSSLYILKYGINKSNSKTILKTEKFDSNLNHTVNSSTLGSESKLDGPQKVGNDNHFSPYYALKSETSNNKAPLTQDTFDSKLKKTTKLKNLTKDGLPILTYHAIDEIVGQDKACYIKPSVFEVEMKYLADNGYTALTFDDLKNYKSYKNPIIITFDDGYRDVYKNAYPILKKYKLKATMFMISGFINHPDYLTADEIKEMSDIFSFQSHTAHHMDLTKLSSEDVEKEFNESNKVIEGLTGKKVTALSYPCSQYNDQVVKIAKKYYSYCVTTKYGFYKLNSDTFSINRIGGYFLYNLRDFMGWI